MNSNLYGKDVEFPENLRNILIRNSRLVPNVPKDSQGYKRNLELQSKKFISYQQLKRIKNFFDKFVGNQNDPEFILNGGVEMKNWVNNELRRMRDFDHTTKQHKMDTGMQNQFIKPHIKNAPSNISPSKSHNKIAKKYNLPIREEINRIKQLLKLI